MSSPVVKIDDGLLKGKVVQTDEGLEYFSFTSIPYAKPPLGELRFSIPQPPEPWEGVRDATQPANICIQYCKFEKKLIGDEDCLYLNVYTPKLPNNGSELLPVMIYFHGGAFSFGSGTDEPTVGPDFFMDKDVIIVGINHRLGILGYLSLDRKEAPGNMGMMDEVQALKWIQKNISNFGGDPNNVTLFGDSAGGASVGYLLLSPMAKGLYHKALAQTGSPLQHWTHNTSSKIKKLAAKIPAMLGKPIADDYHLLRYLKSLPVDILINKSLDALTPEEYREGMHFGFTPTIESPGDWEPFLTKSPYQMLCDGEFSKVPLLTGCCSREGLTMISHCPITYEKFVKSPVFADYFPFDLNEDEKLEVEMKLKSVYMDGEKLFKDADAYAIDFFTDVDILGGLYVSTKLIAKHTTVYFYEFCYDGNMNRLKDVYNINRDGACHGDELSFVLKTNVLTKPMTENCKNIRETITTMWSNFVKYGNPTPKTDNLINTLWEPMPENGMACLVIDNPTRMKYEMYPQRMKLYEEYYEKKHGAK